MSVPDQMQAWKCQIGHGKPLRVQVPTPKPGPGDVLVKILAMGVCHSDCTILGIKESMYGMANEFVLGHEGAGEIAQIGSNVDSNLYKPGNRVGLYLVAGCLKPTCPECSRGLQQLCKSEGGAYGIGREGFFAEYAAVSARSVFRLPDGLEMPLAAVSADAVLTAYHAVKVTAAVKPEQTVAILGLGGLGMNALQTALHLGVKRVLVVDKRRETVDEAVRLGVRPEDAFCTDDPGAKKFHEVVVERQIAIDTCIDLVGHADTVLSAQLALRPAGRLVLVGLLSEQAPLIPVVFVPNGLSIQASYSGSVQSYEECLDLMGKGILRPKIQTGSIEDLPQVLERLDEGKIQGRMVLLPDWKR